jgi:magnesium-transporting ATPase (P-type)
VQHGQPGRGLYDNLARVSFTTLSIQAVGLGYSKAAAGLMDRPPIPPGRPILTRGLIGWLAFTGLLMAAGTLGVISWAGHAHGFAIARTMGMVTFALSSLFGALLDADQHAAVHREADGLDDGAFRDVTPPVASRRHRNLAGPARGAGA